MTQSSFSEREQSVCWDISVDATLTRPWPHLVTLHPSVQLPFTSKKKKHWLTQWLICMCMCAWNLAPVLVVLNTVDGQGNHLDAPLLELAAVLGGAAQLGGAHGREVLGVGEQDAPSVQRDRADQLAGVGVGASFTAGSSVEVNGLWSGRVIQWKGAKDQR